MNLLGSDEKGRLAEVIGHELRNPLASAVASVSVSLEMTDRDDPRTLYLEQTLDDLSRVSTLLTSYLDFGRSGGMNRKDLDLVEVVRKVHERYVSRFVHSTQSSHVAQVGLASSDPSLRMLGDPVLLERLVENLIENAMSMGASYVDIYLESDGDDRILQVSDNGPGVPADLRDELFEPFVSGRGSSGLGLALAKDIVMSHGGTIELLPSLVGARFQITLPATWRR